MERGYLGGIIKRARDLHNVRTGAVSPGTRAEASVEHAPYSPRTWTGLLVLCLRIVGYDQLTQIWFVAVVLQHELKPIDHIKKRNDQQDIELFQINKNVHLHFVNEDNRWPYNISMQEFECNYNFSNTPANIPIAIFNDWIAIVTKKSEMYKLYVNFRLPRVDYHGFVLLIHSSCFRNIYHSTVLTCRGIEVQFIRIMG